MKGGRGGKGRERDSDYEFEALVREKKKTSGLNVQFWKSTKIFKTKEPE